MASPGYSFLALVLVAACPSLEPTEPPDRLSEDRMEAIVADPLRALDRGDLAGAQREVEALLARASAGRHSDILTSFGILLFHRGHMHAALPYLERAIPATIHRFGPDHPEVAMALSSYADARLVVEGDEPSREIDAALEESLRIRLAALGPTHEATYFTMQRLAETKALPSRIAGDPARIAEAAALFERALAGYAANPGKTGSFFADEVRTELARLYVRNGMPDEARALADRLPPAGDACAAAQFPYEVQALIEGHAAAQAAFVAEVERSPGHPCHRDELAGGIPPLRVR